MSIVCVNFGRPAVDRTGFACTFDFSLASTPERNDASAASTQLDSGRPPFLEALKEQLGLKLNPTQAQIPVIVIDYVQ